MKPNEIIDELINSYLKAHPNIEPPVFDDEYMQHPSVIAMTSNIQSWMTDECGGPLEYWSLMLAAAKEWFPDVNKIKLGHIFCVRFECYANTWWDEIEECQPLQKEYYNWRYDA